MKKLAVAVCAAVAAASGAFAGNIYYFDPVNGKDTNDGLSETTAFEHLSKKSGAQASDGDELRLMKGVYKESLSINRCNITVRGWKASRDEVIIDGEGVRRGIQVNGKRAMVANLTVRDAYHEASAANAVNCGAGIQLYEVGAVASNCVVYGCRNAKHCGGGIYLAAASNVVEYCFVSNCLSASGAPGIYAANQCVGQVIHDTTVVCCTNMVASDSAGSGCGGGSDFPACKRSKYSSYLSRWSFGANMFVKQKRW